MHRIAKIIALLAILPLVGTVGLVLIEGWNVFDALYMSVITITTVGFSEIHPLSTAGRSFIIAYLVVGIGVFFYGAVQIGELIVRAELHNWYGRRKMDSALKSMKDHFVVCGFGRTGLAVCRHLAGKQQPFVVVDQDEQILSACRDRGWIGLSGDATSDELLLKANLKSARGLATVLPSDADNLYVVLSARLLCPNLQIVARASDEMSSAKMQKAGANRVVSLFNSGAVKMAQLLVNPELEDFFEIFHSHDIELDLAEIHVTQSGPYSGKTLDDTEFSTQGVVIVGIRRKNGELILPPRGSTPIHVDDQLIALGKSEAISEMVHS